MKFAAQRVDITPTDPVHLGAAGRPTGLSAGVDSRLEANILCLADEEQDATLVVVSLDLLYPGRPLTDAVREHLSERPGVHAFVCASHTHRGPMTDPHKPALGHYNEAYVTAVIEALEPAIDECVRGLQSVQEFRVGEAVAQSSVNRRVRKRLVVARRPRINSFVHAPNPRGPKDELITVIEIHGESGLECLLWNYACHPVGYPEPDRISAHFPGWVRDHLREGQHDQLPVLFLQGFSGDTRPSGTSHVHSVRGKVLQLIAGKMFEDFRRTDYADWCAELTSSVIAARQNVRGVVIDGMESRVSTRPASDFVEGEPGEVEVARVSLGRSLELFFATGELMVEHGLRLRKELPRSAVVPVGCVGQVIGYLPTREIREEGGYEAGTFTERFGQGPMTEQAGAVLDEMFSSLLS